tara:strand:- start:676 stop:1707 length:1032 start_codon:yes stop_codon:yes gene_type:complete
MSNPLFIAGTRPEIIKISTISNYLKSKILFTGQHFDKEMSEIFFKLINKSSLIELGGNNYKEGSHELFINDIKRKLEEINPASVVVQGDTNTTLYGALAAKSLGIKINYIESGMRSGDINQIEEINRIIVSGLADLNFCNHENNRENLLLENINEKKICVSGSTVFSVLSENHLINEIHESNKEKFILLTLHRPENVDDKKKIFSILETINSIGEKITFVTHPRVQEIINSNSMQSYNNITLEKPKNYFDFINLLKSSFFVISDSGGIQEESAILRKPLLIPRKFTERPEMLNIFNLLVETNEELLNESKKLLNGTSILEKIQNKDLLYGESEVLNTISKNII